MSNPTNMTANPAQGVCNAPFLQMSHFPPTGGYIPGRFCAAVPTLNGLVDCCLPCPVTDWVFSDDFHRVPTAANWLNVIGIICSCMLLLGYVALPLKYTNRHYLTIGLVITTIILQLGFIIPMGVQPQQCHNAITPNDMRSDATCAISGSLLLYGGFASVIWGFLRFLSIHLQICWKVTPGRRLFWLSMLIGWGVPALMLAINLPITGVSYRFGGTCHINHRKALEAYFGPLLALTAALALVQFVTAVYCIRVFLRSVWQDSPTPSRNFSKYTQRPRKCDEKVELVDELPSHCSSQANSIKMTMTPGMQAYRRMQRIILMQWRAMALVVIIIISVVFLSVVFVELDNTVTKASSDFRQVEPWLFCLVINGGRKDACLDQVRKTHLVPRQSKVAAVLVLLSLTGIWAALFVGQPSMLTGWRELVTRQLERIRKRSTPSRDRVDFVSVDAQRVSIYGSKYYEKMMTPSPRSCITPSTTLCPTPTATAGFDLRPMSALSMPWDCRAEDKLAPGERLSVDLTPPPAVAPPESPSSHYTTDYFGRENPPLPKSSASSDQAPQVTPQCVMPKEAWPWRMSAPLHVSTQHESSNHRPVSPLTTVSGRHPSLASLPISPEPSHDSTTQYSAKSFPAPPTKTKHRPSFLRLSTTDSQLTSVIAPSRSISLHQAVDRQPEATPPRDSNRRQSPPNQFNVPLPRPHSQQQRDQREGFTCREPDWDSISSYARSGL